MTDTDMDEWTEATDAVIPRADLVGLAANGVDQWLVMKQDAVGLLDPDYVRELIAKSDPQAPDARETVTMTGSPTAIAEMMRQVHGAPMRKAEMSAKSINDLPDSAFAHIEPGGKKDESGRTVPRSLRHYPVHDEVHARNALGRAEAQIQNGDADAKRIARAALPKIRSAAKKFGIEVSKESGMAVVTGEADNGIDGMDPTVVLTEAEDEAPGDPSEPGSPAWEAIDAATARKWTAIAVRLRNALGVLADRELLEAATVDPGDAESAFNLEDAQCCLDCVIDTLAGFAVEEQAEADLAGEAMEQIGKALAGFDPAPLELIEGLAPLRKAGRVLSAANEAAIRGAVESLQKVLASLPQAPTAPNEEGGRAVAKTANEEPEMPAPTLTTDVTEESGQQPAMGVKQAEPKAPAGVVVTDVAKADGEKTPMVVVYDQKGRLIGIVDPQDVTPVANAEADADDMDGTQDGDGAQPGPAAAAAPTDLTPAPSGDAGTPADAVEKSAAAPADAISAADQQDVLKSSITALVKAAVDDYSASQAEIVKRLEDQGAALEERNTTLETSLAEQVAKNADLTARLTHLENQPAVMAIASNGAVPRPPQLRGQDYGAPVADASQALELRKQLAEAPDAGTRERVANEMNGLAIEGYRALRQQPPTR